MDNQQLIFLLSNPFTFGALLSWFCEQIPWFKDPKNSNWIKFSIVVAVCFAWSWFRAILDKDGWLTTAAEWKAVVATSVAVAVSTQIANVLLPGLVDLLKSLKATPVTVTATTANTSTFANGSTTTTTSVNAELPLAQKIEASAANLPVSTDPQPPYRTPDGTAVG